MKLKVFRITVKLKAVSHLVVSLIVIKYITACVLLAFLFIFISFDAIMAFLHRIWCCLLSKVICYDYATIQGRIALLLQGLYILGMVCISSFLSVIYMIDEWTISINTHQYASFT